LRRSAAQFAAGLTGPVVKTAFGYSRFKNVHGQARDAEQVLRA